MSTMERHRQGIKLGYVEGLYMGQMGLHRRNGGFQNKW